MGGLTDVDDGAPAFGDGLTAGWPAGAPRTSGPGTGPALSGPAVSETAVSEAAAAGRSVTEAERDHPGVGP